MLTKTLFNIYSRNLHMLVESRLLPGLVLHYEKTYICPLCLKQFSEDDLDTSKAVHLTLEHVPPDSLGGKHYLLTCNICNSKCGHEIDHHLYEQMLQIENSQFLPDSEFNVFIFQDDLRVQGLINVSSSGSLNLTLLDKNNNPKNIIKFNRAIDTNSASRVVTVKNRQRREIKFDRIPVALLKIAYLLAFEKFGYLFLLDNTYTIVRDQILRPSYKLYTHKFWTEYNMTEKYIGTYLVRDSGLQSIMSNFSLKTKKFNIDLVTLLPLPYPFYSVDKVVNSIDNMARKRRPLSMYNPHTNFLKSIDENYGLHDALKVNRIRYIGLRD